MKKILSLAAALMLAAGIQAQTTGTQKALIGGVEKDMNWVQLWAGGPKFATMNAGATAAGYENATDYTEAAVGMYYQRTEADDLVTAAWGDNWVMPAEQDYTNLLNKEKCTFEWMDGEEKQFAEGCTLKGFKVSGVGNYANNSVFFPAAGRYTGNNPGDGFSGTGYGYYWTSAPVNEGDNGKILSFFCNGENQGKGLRDCYKWYRCTVRAILNEDAPAGISEVSSATSTKVVKKLDGGRVILHKNGKNFDVTGRQVK